MLRLHLPPNFSAAVVRNAVPLRVEVDLTIVPPAELMPVLALLQRWCGTPTPPKFIQLNRAQLRELAAAAGDQPIFIEGGRNGPWRHDELLGPDQEPGVKDCGIQSADRGLAEKPADRRTALRAPARGAPSVSNSAIRNPQSELRSPQSGLVVDGSEHFLAITLPSREDRCYDSAAALLKENGFALEPSNRKWWLRDRHKTLNFLAAYYVELRDRFGAAFTPNFEKNTARIRPTEIVADASMSGGRYSVSIGVRAGGADEAAIRSAIASNRGYVESNDAIYLLDPAKLQQLAVAQRALAGNPNATVAARQAVTISAARVAEVQEVLEQLSPNFQPPEAWRHRSAALRNLTTIAPAPVPPDLERLLRPYQKLGVAWLWHLQHHDLGGILADEMGLGKTIQALALLSARRCAMMPEGGESRGLGGPNAPESRRPSSSGNSPPPAGALVVCPASLLENWRREATRFVPELRVFVHHGEHRLEGVTDLAHHALIITSYGTLTRDQTLFASAQFDVVVADEAQHIKNRRSQNAAALRALDARSRFLLTGTPVENSLEDLRSLFEFLLPGYLTKLPAGIRGDERTWYDERLRAQTAPYILRRTKKSVAPELPDKIEQVVWCELEDEQAALYRTVQERMERELIDLEASGASEAKLKFAALTQLLRLRQICCDPRLIAPSGSPTLTGQSPADIAEPAQASAAGAHALVPSAKLAAFRELLEEAIDDGHRVLVFSQFTSLLALLRQELDDQALGYCYLDGSMPATARQAQVDRFQKSADIPLFLLSLKAGGTGLNLTGADTVIHYDPWWNPAAEAQATDRAHRIGQTRTVTSYKLIAAGTVEEKVLALQQEKRALLADVFEASDSAAARLTLADLRGLLT